MGARARLERRGRIRTEVPLAGHTTYKIGGAARFLVTVEDREDVADVFEFAASAGLPIVPLGRGSNVVVSDSGFDGIVVTSGPGLAHRTIGETVVAGCAVPLPLLARESAKAGRGGLEFFTGIPGSVGGAVRMNAGCHGSETREVLIAAKVFDAEEGRVTELGPDSLGLSYRHSNLTDRQFVLEASFATAPVDPAAAEARIKEITRWRRDNQPGGTLNAGSVFKNPPSEAAGRLIDATGLKGLTVGGVKVSERHANFFEAADHATSADLHALVVEVGRRVLESTGIELEPEIRFLGEF